MRRAEFTQLFLLLLMLRLFLLLLMLLLLLFFLLLLLMLWLAVLRGRRRSCAFVFFVVKALPDAGKERLLRSCPESGCLFLA